MQNAFWQSGSDSRCFLNNFLSSKYLNGTRDPPPLHGKIHPIFPFWLFEPLPKVDLQGLRWWRWFSKLVDKPFILLFGLNLSQNFCFYIAPKASVQCKFQIVIIAHHHHRRHHHHQGHPLHHLSNIMNVSPKNANAGSTSTQRSMFSSSAKLQDWFHLCVNHNKMRA